MVGIIEDFKFVPLRLLSLGGVDQGSIPKGTNLNSSKGTKD